MFTRSKRKPRRRFNRRKTSIKRIKRVPPSRRVYKFIRTSQGVYDSVSSAVILNMNASSAGTTYYSFMFRLSDIPNYTEFTNLYDQYRITGVSVKFFPQQDSANTGISNATTAIIHTAADYNDATAITTEQDILQYQTLRTHRFDTIFHYYLKPRVATAIYNNVATTGYAQSGHPWIDVSSPSAPFYGLKVVVPTVSASSLSGWRLYATFYIECRDVR